MSIILLLIEWLWYLGVGGDMALMICKFTGGLTERGETVFTIWSIITIIIMIIYYALRATKK